MADTRQQADRDRMTSAHDLGIALIDAYLELLRRRGCTADTIKIRRVVLRRLHRDLPGGIGQTTDEELAAWLYRDEWTQNTRATYCQSVKLFYQWAADPKDPWISFDPAADLPRVPKPRGVARAATDEQVQTILARAAQPFRRWATIAAYQGLRCIEIAGLDRDHITSANLLVVRGKGGRPRVHDTDPYVWEAVRALPPGPVAVWRGRRATAYEVSARTNRHFATMGLDGVTMHRLRHWLGCRIQAACKDPRVTQAVLGQLSLASTQIYTDATADQQRAARAMLPRLAG